MDAEFVTFKLVYNRNFNWFCVAHFCVTSSALITRAGYKEAQGDGCLSVLQCIVQCQGSDKADIPLSMKWDVEKGEVAINAS